MATHPKTSMKRAAAKAPVRTTKTASRTAARSTLANKAAGPKSTAKSTPAKSAPGRQGRTGKRTTSKGAAREAAPSLLRPIRQKQTRAQIIATIASDTGVPAGTVESVARSLSQTLTRHLIRGGSGRVEIPYLGAALWRGRTAAQKARTMMNAALGRTVNVPARRSQPAARLRAHQALRDAVART